MYVLVNGKYRNYWKYTVRISKWEEGGGGKVGSPSKPFKFIFSHI